MKMSWNSPSAFRASIIVELAILLPVMVTVLAMILHFSLYLYWQNQLDNSAHRLVKILVLEQSANGSFAASNANSVLNELQAVYSPSYRNQFGVSFSLVSDVSARNLTEAAGANCHQQKPVLTSINTLNVARTAAMDERNIAVLSLCLDLSERLPLSAFTFGEFASGLGQIQRVSYYPISPTVF